MKFPVVNSRVRSWVCTVISSSIIGLVSTQAYAVWNWADTQDPYTSSEIDMRVLLNEEIAGQSGWVTHRQGTFYRGDGQPIRFWGLTASAQGTYEQQVEQLKFQAKRGINLYRWHTSVFTNSSQNIYDVNMSRIDDLHRIVAAAREQGVYVNVSYFFILGMRVNASWELDGYTQQWMDANPSIAKDNPPFGLMFFDEKFKAAFKEYIRVILETPNPYHPEQTPLKDEPAVAMFELQNEDSLFFPTFRINRFPPVQQQKIFKQYGDWLIARYGSIQGAIDTWGGVGSNALSEYDDAANGRMTVVGRSELATPSSVNPNTPASRRLADNILFLTETQINFYQELKEYAQELGYQGTFIASNWRTQDTANLDDIEFYTYVNGAGVVDIHNYFDPYRKQGANTAGAGDIFYGIPAVENPRRAPVALKAVENHPYTMSENTWVNPSEYASEAALLVAAYSSLRGVDGWMWFAHGGAGWNNTYHTWPVAVPSMMGQFPAASLLYRRGDVAKAPVMVREGRKPETMYNRYSNIIRVTPGWDVTRDPDREFNYDPVANQGVVDSLATMVGQVELAYDTDVDFVHPDLSTFIDNEGKKVTSATGELSLDWNKKQLSIKSPRAQGAVGVIRNTAFNLGDIQINGGSGYNFGAVVAISLDGEPLATSKKILLQAGTQGQLTGYTTEPATISGLQGKRIVAAGAPPYVMEDIDARVTLLGRAVADIDTIRVLDENGYPKTQLVAQNTSQGPRISLPTNAFYTVVTFKDTAETPKVAPVILTKGLPTAHAGEEYTASLSAAGGTGTLKWAVADGATLPAGLSLSEDGVLSGPAARTSDEVVKSVDISVKVTDAEGLSSTASIPLLLVTIPAESLYKDGASWTRFGDFAFNISVGFVYDYYYPFIYFYSYQGWIYSFADADANENDNYYIYDFRDNRFGYVIPEFYPYYIRLDGVEGFVDLSQSQ